MIRDSNPDADSVVAVYEFLARLLADRDEGEEYPLAHYQALFPGHEERIAQEFASLSAPGESKPGPHCLGRFRILEELGRGGQGVVYLAEDPELHRELALKVLAAPVGLSPDALLRFRREAEAASRLDHPGICTVYEAGEVEGAPYIAMRYVRGETLREKLAAARETESSSHASRKTDGTSPGSETRAHVLRVVRLVEDVARALHHAHERGLVHRDIKPGNILIADEGGPVVLDFGLVRDQLGDAEGLTASGDLLGTPAYLSPEQLRGRPPALDRRTDVYSLGVTLYECLCLRRPFEAPTRDGLYRRILTEPAPDVRRLNRHVPAELKVVLETALEKDRDRRYQTALDLAEDLRRVRERQPIQARPPGPGLRLRRWVQRNPAPSVALVVLVLGVVIAGILLQRGNVALDRLRAVVLADASIEVQEKNGLLALRLAREAVRVDRTPYTISQLHAALATAFERALLEGHEDPVTHVTFSPDGDSALTSSEDGTARLWSLEGEQLAAFEHARGGDVPVRRATFSPDGQRVLTAYGTACVWSLDGALRGELPVEGKVHNTNAAFSPRGRWILSTSGDGTARIWEGDGPWDHPVQTLRGHSDVVLGGAFSPDEERVVTVSKDGTANVWECAGARWEQLSTLGGPGGHEGPVWGACFSPGGELVLTFSSNGLGLMRTRDFTARLWGAYGELLEVFEHDGILLSAEFSPEGDAVLTAADDGFVKLWNIDEGGRLVEVVPLFVDRTKRSLSARFSPAGDRILVAGANGFACVLDRSGRETAALRGHSAWVLDGAFSPDGTLVATGGFDRTVRIWELSNPELPVLGHGGPIGSMDVSRHRVATISPNGTLRLWDRRGALLWERFHPNRYRKYSSHVAFGPGGDRIVTTSDIGRVIVWDLEGQKVDEFKVPNDALTAAAAISPGGESILVGSHRGVNLFGPDKTQVQHFPCTGIHVEFSPSGDRILTASRKGGARVWSLDGELLEQLIHSHQVPYATFSPAGDQVLTACADDRAYLWDLTRGPRDAEGRLEPTRTFVGHEGALYAGAFSPDGRLVVTGSTDGTARLWTIDGSTVAVLRGHLGAVRAVAFTPDGKRILTASSDGTVRTWVVNPDELIELADQRLTGRALTEEEQDRFAELLGK